MSNLVEISGVKKGYGISKTVFENLNLALPEGKIIGLLGQVLYLLRNVPTCFEYKEGTGSASLASRHNCSLTRCLGRSEHCVPGLGQPFHQTLAR